MRKSKRVYYITSKSRTIKKFEETRLRQLIRRRRRQMLIHSFLYYRMNTNLISDQQFDAWAKELADLQKEHPKISRHLEFYSLFKDWDGSTGYHLPYLPQIEAVAKRLLGRSDRIVKVPKLELSKNRKKPNPPRNI